jgi:stage III sporulation protein AG
LANLLKWLESKLGGGANGQKRVRTFQWLIVMGLIGAALMILNSFLRVETIDPEPDPAPVAGGDQEVFRHAESSDNPFDAYERLYESRLREILEKIVGVGNVDVMVTIESTEESIVYRDMHESEQETNERDGNGAQRHITSVTRDGTIALYTVSGQSKPIILKLIKPQIRGVIIVANGAENSVVKQMLAEAVQRGLGVSPTRISILPRKT